MLRPLLSVTRRGLPALLVLVWCSQPMSVLRSCDRAFAVPLTSSRLVAACRSYRRARRLSPARPTLHPLQELP